MCIFKNILISFYIKIVSSLVCVYFLAGKNILISLCIQIISSLVCVYFLCAWLENAPKYTLIVVGVQVNIF